MSWLSRMFTLPKRYNSLSDIARDPLGAIANAAQWAVPLAMGLPGGIGGLSKVLSNPALLGKWSLGNLTANVGKLSLGSLGSLGKLKSGDIALGVGGYLLLDSQRRADAAARALSGQGDIYRRLFELQAPVYEQVQRLRSDALAGVPDVPTYEAEARRALDEALRILDESERARGVRTLSSDRRRAEALARYSTAVAGYPLQRLQVLFGLPASQALQPLQLQTQILAGQSGIAQSQLQGLAQALAYLMPSLIR